MTSLRGLLGGRCRPGIYRVDDDLTLERAREQAQSAGWQVFELDGSRVVDKESLFEGLTSVLPLPEWMGRNWDALEEILDSPEVFDPHVGTIVIFDRPDRLLYHSGDVAELFFEILTGAISSRTESSSPLYILLRRAGSAYTSLPWL